MTTEVIRVEGLAKDVRPGFGLRRQRVLHDISFTVERGEIFGFVGPNGAGKTTTMKILIGLTRPTHGRVTVLGHAVQESLHTLYGSPSLENEVIGAQSSSSSSWQRGPSVDQS